MAWWAALIEMAKKKAEQNQQEKDSAAKESNSKVGESSNQNLPNAPELKSAFSVLADDEEAKKRARENRTKMWGI